MSETNEELIEIVVDGVPVPVSRSKYELAPNSVEELVRRNRKTVRFIGDGDYDEAGTILAPGQEEVV